MERAVACTHRSRRTRSRRTCCARRMSIESTNFGTDQSKIFTRTRWPSQKLFAAAFRKSLFVISILVASIML